MYLLPVNKEYNCDSQKEKTQNQGFAWEKLKWSWNGPLHGPRCGFVLVIYLFII